MTLPDERDLSLSKENKQLPAKKETSLNFFLLIVWTNQVFFKFPDWALRRH